MAEYRQTDKKGVASMAKITDPIPEQDLPFEIQGIIKRANCRGQDYAAIYADMPTPPPEWIAEQAELYANAKAAWDRIAPWKKIRWSLCAIAKWGDAVTVSGATGYSGFTLYVKCWLEQKPEPDKQPLSPCSARATDPGANPWNYQP